MCISDISSSKLTNQINVQNLDCRAFAIKTLGKGYQLYCHPLNHLLIQIRYLHGPKFSFPAPPPPPPTLTLFHISLSFLSLSLGLYVLAPYLPAFFVDVKMDNGHNKGGYGRYRMSIYGPVSSCHGPFEGMSAQSVRSS